MVPAAAPPRVRDRLRAAPDGPVPVVHRGPHAVYVEVGGWCVGVVATAAAQVPCAMRVAGDTVPGTEATALTARVEDGTLHLGGTALPVGRLVTTAVPRLRGGAVSASVAMPSPVAALVVDHLPERRVDADAVPRLLGRGEGLTPLGDDLLAGWLALHRAAGVPTPAVDAAVREHASATTRLSATLLDCALHGEVLPEYAAWVRAIGTADQPHRVRALHRVGATSGAGLHQGGEIALAQITEAA